MRNQSFAVLIGGWLVTALVMVLLVFAPAGVGAQSRPALVPPYEEGPFKEFSTVYRGIDYRLTVWSNGAALLVFDDGDQAQIRLVTNVSTAPSAQSASGLTAVGEVMSTSNAERAPFGARVVLMPYLEMVKGSPARFAIVRPDGIQLRNELVCHPVVGNGAWEVYPCF